MDPATIAALAKESAQIAPNLAKTILSIKDDRDRQKFEQNLALLTTKQQIELEAKLANVQSQTDRMKIISETMLQLAISNQQAAARNKVILLVVAGVMAVGLLIGAIIISKKTT